LQATLNALPDLLIELNRQGVYRVVHSHKETDLGRPVHQLLNRPLSEVLPKDASDSCMLALQEAAETGRSTGRQYSLETPQGKQWFELSVVRKPTEPGEEDRFIAIVRDVTERKQTAEAIEHLAFHDSLTGLPNRRLLQERLLRAMTTSHRDHQHNALMFLDLDKFKQLNDQHGHDVGDLMLQEVARRLQQDIRAVDTVARLGGDEFVVLIQGLSTDMQDAKLYAAAVGHKILASLNEPYQREGASHICTPSIGVSLFMGEDLSPTDVIKQADTAMYQAKARGRNTVCFYT
jgi:diguanylate cyclase (GGDEF)-like protein/PAS domain S-box-containing protein